MDWLARLKKSRTLPRLAESVWTLPPGRTREKSQAVRVVLSGSDLSDLPDLSCASSGVMESAGAASGSSARTGAEKTSGSSEEKG